MADQGISTFDNCWKRILKMKRSFITLWASQIKNVHHTRVLLVLKVKLKVLLTQSCPTLCDPTDRSPPGSSVHVISQARLLEWVAISYSRRSSPASNQTCVSCLAGGFLTTEPPGKPLLTWLIGKMICMTPIKWSYPTLMKCFRNF